MIRFPVAKSRLCADVDLADTVDVRPSYTMVVGLLSEARSEAHLVLAQLYLDGMSEG